MITPCYFKLRLFFWVILLCCSNSCVRGGAASDFQALMAFKSSLRNTKGIDDWGKQPKNPCSWTGITCRHGKVVALSLPHFGLQGLLPPALTSFSNLQLLDLSENEFSGSIPSQFWKLEKLETVDLSFNLLNGTLSSAVQNLKNLKSLSLGFNSFSGEIPEELSSLSELEELDLGGNGFSGPIPLSIGNLTKLQALDISNNSITGPIPFTIGKMAALRDLQIGHNKFGSSLPRGISNLTNLIILRAPSCTLKGPIPEEISNLQSLEHLDLSGNQLQSPIPPSIGKLQNLTMLIISNAEVNGTVPAELGNCQKLETALLNFNKLYGVLPDALVGLSKSIIYFSIEQNTIEGQLPSWFGKWQFAESILLASNQFQGSIPPELGNCSSLSQLSLRNNRLSGNIPSDLCNSKFLSDVDLGSNLLTGSIEDTFRHCKNISQLILVQNQLTGTIPAYLSDLPLVSLELDYNNFSGEVPDEMWSSKSLLEFSAGFNFIQGRLSSRIGNLVTLERLILNNNLLEGGVPKEIENLQSLSVLSLSQNNLSGEIPAELFKLKSMTSLDLGYNKFTGRIPENIEDLKELEYLVLSHNHLSGSLPIGITRGFRQAIIPDTSYLQHRGVLDLSMNKISGKIPEELGDCTVIVELLLENNNFTGEIPTSIFRLPNLVSVDLSSNQLDGKIPAEVGDAENLQGLMLAYNHLEGGIPSELGKLKYLVKLNLSGNQLTGEIPASVGNLQSLSDLDLSRNHISGSIPSSLSKLESIVGLYLQQNRLSGDISTVLMHSSLWRQIGTLNLSVNTFNGEIPSSISNLLCLTSLDLHNNRFTGTITRYIGNLSQLQYLDISENFIHGPIPRELCDLTNLRYLNLSNNLLRGQVLDCFKFTGDTSLNSGDPCGTSAEEKCNTRTGWKRHFLLLILAASILSLTTSFSIICLILIFLKRKIQFLDTMKSLQQQASLDVNTATVIKQSSQQFTFSDVIHITNNFSKSNVIGSGGSSTVYRGFLPSGKLVAIKKLGKARDKGSKEFLAEMEAIGRVKHKNLIQLIGSCSFEDEKVLIYEYMECGSLDSWLRNKREVSKGLLDWSKRLKIVIGTARGLAFLHHNVVPPVIHRDVKASNILLDHDFEPRVADFGLARILRVHDTHVTTETAGTLGYIAPEYGQTWKSTMKGDVYSFGVILLEMVTGKEPTGSEFKDVEGGNLVWWVREMVIKGMEVECLYGEVSDGSRWEAQMLKLLYLGLNCTKEDPMRRPSMQEVVFCLEFIEINF